MKPRIETLNRRYFSQIIMKKSFPLILMFTIAVLISGTAKADCVVLLHGLARTSKSMNIIGEAFQHQGFKVVNIDYPSRSEPVEKLAPKAIDAGIKACNTDSNEKIHFVTHSMGGILVRYYLAEHKIINLGRVVMLAPPNNGSEVIDNLKNMPGFKMVNGPAGLQLGTQPESIPSRLGAVDYPVGIIAGSQTVNPILSQYLPNPDDGKVSVQSTKVKGMTDFILLPVSHPFIMRDEEAIRQAIAFIETGSFIHNPPEKPAAPKSKNE